MSRTIDLPRIRAAAQAISDQTHRTPVMRCSTLDALAGRRLLFKCENFQRAGAFKFRGACNAISQLDEQTAARGVVTHSSGNHAQALALAARTRGIPAYVVMPSNSSPVKLAAVREYGAEIILCEPKLAARDSTANEVRQRTGATFIHPYDNADIIAGQGTAMLEFIEQADAEGEHLNAVIAPVGGGGLLAGTAIAAKALDADIRVIAAEPAGADDAARSLAAGQLIPQTAPNTIADGLLTSLGELNWPIIRDHVERVVTVSDDKIVRAMRLLFERAKLIVEPSAAVVLAAVLSDEFRVLDGLDCVGLILSGGNANLDALPWT